MIKKPDDFDLTRRLDGQSPDGSIRAAVLAALVLGESPGQIAEQYNLPVAQVEQWKRRFDITDPIQRRDQLSEQLLIFVQQKIKNLVAISVATSDEDWIHEQSASELAAYLRAEHEMLLRVFEAFGRTAQHQAELEAARIEMDDD